MKKQEEKQPPLQLLGFIVDKIRRPIPRKWTFIPKEDITTYELCLLLPFLFTSGRPGIYSKDLEYLEEYNLLRHLLIEDAPEVLTTSPVTNKQKQN